MKKFDYLIGLLLIFFAGLFLIFIIDNYLSGESMNFKIESTSFVHNGEIPSKYTCDGENILPELHWSNAPKETKSFAIIVDDPDAPKAKPFVHMVLFNIPSTVTNLPEGTSQGEFTFGKNDFNEPDLIHKFGGPCPPSGTHRYFFKIYALDIEKINLNQNATKNDILKAINGHILAHTEMIGLYKRKK